MEAVKLDLRATYDYILIDSRTGICDTAGICTVQLPDDLVVCFTLNRQSVLGAVAASAWNQRKVHSDGGHRLRIWPVPSRIENAERESRDRMQKQAMRAFQPLVNHIASDELERYWAGSG